MDETDTKEVERIINAGRKLLAGKAPEMQGAVLADLLAIWLAGHIVRESAADTDALREKLLDHHIELVRRLIPINAAQIHAPK